MLSLILFFSLLWSFYIGYSRGIVLQLFYSLSSFLALMVASAQYKTLAGLLYLWVPFASATEGSSTYYFASQYLFQLDEVFYAGLAFLLIYMVVYAVLRFIGIFVHLLNVLNPNLLLTNLVSGVLSVLVTLISLQLVLTIVATIPITSVQTLLHESFLANAIITYTPIMTDFLKQMWVTNTIG